MLFNLEPDRSVTGGAWYQDQDFEAEFVDVLNQQSLRFLQMRKTAAKDLKEGPLAAMKFACCSVQDVHKFISELGISKVWHILTTTLNILFKKLMNEKKNGFR